MSKKRWPDPVCRRLYINTIKLKKKEKFAEKYHLMNLAIKIRSGDVRAKAVNCIHVLAIINDFKSHNYLFVIVFKAKLALS